MFLIVILSIHRVVLSVIVHGLTPNLYTMNSGLEPYCTTIPEFIEVLDNFGTANMTLYNLIKETEVFINCSPSKKKSMVEKYRRFHIWVEEEIDILHENLDIATKNGKDEVIEFNVTIFDIWNRVLQRLSKKFETDQRFVAHSEAMKVALPLISNAIFIMMHGVYGTQFIVYPDVDEMDIKANKFYEETGKRFHEKKMLQVDRGTEEVMKYITDPEKKKIIETKYQASKQKYEDKMYYFLLCRQWPRYVLKVETFHRRELLMPKQLVLHVADDSDAEIDVVNVDEDDERLPIHIRMNPLGYNHDESDSDQSGYYDDYEEPDNVESNGDVKQLETDVNQDRQEASAQKENADCIPRPTHDEFLSSSQSSANRIPEPRKNNSTKMIPSLQNPVPRQLLYVHGPISQEEPGSEQSQSKYLEKKCKAEKDEQKQDMICHEKLAQRTLNEESLEALENPGRLKKAPGSPKENSTLYGKFDCENNQNIFGTSESEGGENDPTKNKSAESVDGGSEQTNEPANSNSKRAYKESESSEKSTNKTSSSSTKATEVSNNQQQSTQSSGSGIPNSAPGQTHETPKPPEESRNNDFKSMKNPSVNLVHKSSSLPNLTPKDQTDLKKGASITKNSSSSNSLESDVKQKSISGTPPLNYDIGTPQSFHSTSSMGSNPASPEHLEAPPSIQTLQTSGSRDSAPLDETKEKKKSVDLSLEKTYELVDQEKITPSLKLPSNREESSSNLPFNLRKRPHSPENERDIPPKI
ncbi:hypothetical protein L5515_016063 [Caenorhabditis briggsae]|uniref:Uncharacterized protein n=1 Tax=Caenorhabditis briggsae TaxID=6238 RepID=A0AAE9JN16_CAEBR|nr:hypothetical protein L5515_016063 [Caenorhabditis briggsae]